MRKRNLIWCGPEKLPESYSKDFDKKVILNSYPQNQNVYLKLENISSKFAKDINPLVMDLLEVGSYVYCADQTVSRGGKTWRNNGEDWNRNFVFEIPVRDADLWNREEVKNPLKEALSFLSDDNYEFHFRSLKSEVPQDSYFYFDEGKPWFDADEVLLFSGGLDSLAGAIEEMKSHHKKVLLVSHRPAPKIASRQKRLLENLCNYKEFKGEFLHIPVWVNKDSGLTKDTNQRTRSFLYAMLATGVAIMQGIDKIKFYENGIVSINLPIADQIVGARASRSTHPKALKHMSDFLSCLLGKDFKVTNPFIWDTKSDVIRKIQSSEMVDLIKYSNSCSHVRTSDVLEDHCGVCSQCIERRLAIECNSLTESEVIDRYKIDLFNGQLQRTEDKVMVESYIRHAMELEDMTVEIFFSKFPEVFRLNDCMNLSPSEIAESVYNLHVRHGKQVNSVLKDQIAKNSNLILKNKLDSYSLLSMLISSHPMQGRKWFEELRFPTPEGIDWKDISIEIVSNDSLVVRAGEITKRYHAFDLGFRDNRKRDLPNKQWEVLKFLAECNGRLSWESRGAKTGIQKQMQLLRKILKNFFGFSSNPIQGYRKETGYHTKFKITDSSYSRNSNIR